MASAVMVFVCVTPATVVVAVVLSAVVLMVVVIVASVACVVCVTVCHHLLGNTVSYQPAPLMRLVLSVVAVVNVLMGLADVTRSGRVLRVKRFAAHQLTPFHALEVVRVLQVLVCVAVDSPGVTVVRSVAHKTVAHMAHVTMVFVSVTLDGRDQLVVSRPVRTCVMQQGMAAVLVLSVYALEVTQEMTVRHHHHQRQHRLGRHHWPNARPSVKAIVV